MTWTLAIAYALRGAYTAGVIKSWLIWEGEPYDPISIAWAGLTWPAVIYRGRKALRGR